jgi:hypothetical protein
MVRLLTRKEIANRESAATVRSPAKVFMIISATPRSSHVLVKVFTIVNACDAIKIDAFPIEQLARRALAARFAEYRTLSWARRENVKDAPLKPKQRMSAPSTVNSCGISGAFRECKYDARRCGPIRYLLAVQD